MADFCIDPLLNTKSGLFNSSSMLYNISTYYLTCTGGSDPLSSKFQSAETNVHNLLLSIDKIYTNHISPECHLDLVKLGGNLKNVSQVSVFLFFGHKFQKFNL